MTLGILNNGDDISAINDTHISLVHKVKDPSHVDLRPISLCNVNYKLVPKIIINTCRTSTPFVINDSHAFVESRSIIVMLLLRLKLVTL